MTETREHGFTPQEAIEALTELEDHEEALTARAAGITWLIWGAVVAGIFMTYNVGGFWIESSAAPAWLFGVLWAPWTLIGILATNWLWETTAITVAGAQGEGYTWLESVAYTALFFVIMGGVYGLTVLADIQLGTNEIMLVITGLFTIALGLVYRDQGFDGTRYNVAGGTLLIFAGLALTTTGWSYAALGLASASAVALVYAAIGASLYARG